MSASVRRQDPFAARDTFEVDGRRLGIYRLSRLEQAGHCRIAEMPFSIRVLLESVLRNCDGFEVTEEDVKNLAAWNARNSPEIEIPFKPARVVLQDFTGVPAVVDLAAMRSAMQRLGGDPKKINPLIPVDLVIDHSVQVDHFGTADALAAECRSGIQTQSRTVRVSCVGDNRRSTISASCRPTSASCIR